MTKLMHWGRICHGLASSSGRPLLALFRAGFTSGTGGPVARSLTHNRLTNNHSPPLMKKLSYLLSALLFAGLTSTSQAQTTPKAAHHAHSATKSMAKDGCMMKDGKMMMMKGGKMMPMTADMTMADGTMCMTDGTCKMKDGTTMKMKDGQCMMMDGKMKSMDEMKKSGIMKDGKMKGGKMDNMKM
jgi:hypothetical protein